MIVEVSNTPSSALQALHYPPQYRYFDEVVVVFWDKWEGHGCRSEVKEGASVFVEEAGLSLGHMIVTAHLGCCRWSKGNNTLLPSINCPDLDFWQTFLEPHLFGWD